MLFEKCIMHTASIDIYGLMMRGYYFTSICIIAISIFIFLWSFEKRKPKTREIVTLAVMTALAVVGRLAFFMTPQVKPCAAIIIITGVMLGRQSGFLCGALTAFVSGFFFGQGPWTPWQMIAFGIIGFLSGVLFSKKNIKYAYNKWIISIYGFLATFIIYGFILDTATVFMYTDAPKTETFVATYLSGIVFNLIHAASTFVVLFLISNATIKKLERLKIKYKMFS